MGYLMTALQIIFAFGLVIFVHEFGHFIVAKKMGVKVLRFSFGLGPEMIGFQWGETRYCIAWIPLGGEVRMAGEMEYEELGDAPKPKDPREYFAQAWYRRIPIIVAGPAMNYVLAAAIFTGVTYFWADGRPVPDPVVGEVLAGSPAEKAGLKSGDRFLVVRGESVSQWQKVADIIHVNADVPVSLEIQRGEKKMSMVVTPMLDPSDKKGRIGIAPSMIYEKTPLWSSVKIGVKQTYYISVFTLQYLGEKIAKREKPDLSGPLGIAAAVAKAAKSGFKDLLTFIGLISVGIGLFNLFPVPMLDGGHLMFNLWEGIFRKPMGRRAIQWANTFGLSVLVGILIFATYSDLQHFRASRRKTAVEAAPKVP